MNTKEETMNTTEGAWHEGIELEGIEKAEPTTIPESTDEEKARFRDVIAAYLEGIAEASKAGDVGETALRSVKLTVELLVCLSVGKPDPTRAAIEVGGILTRALINETTERVAQVQKVKSFEVDSTTGANTIKRRER